jgi:hypothetical protein
MRQLRLSKDEAKKTKGNGLYIAAALCKKETL